MTAQEDIGQLQALEQNMQHLSTQRQQFQAQLVEVDSALLALASSPDAYRIIGNLMVKAQSKDVQHELQEKKDVLGIRIKNIEKQEERLKSKADALRKDILSGMKDDEA